MELCQVSWKDYNGDTQKGLLVQFVHDQYYTYGMVMINKRFQKVLYSDLEFERWMS